MENNVNQIPMQERTEKVLPGILGALLFSLSGGIVWFVLWQAGIVAGLSGFVGVFCAIKGYEIFAKKSSVKGTVIASVLALAVIVFAWYLCLGYDYYLDMTSSGFEVPLTECLFSGFDYLDLADAVGMPEVRSGYISDLAFGVVFALVACVGYIVQSAKNAKAMKVAAPQAPVLNGGEEEQNEVPKEE